MTVGLVDLGVFLSGGAGNSDPNLSLGGVISSTRVISQVATPSSPFAGAVIVDGVANTPGSGTLTYTAATNTFTWAPPGETAGPGVVVSGNTTIIVRGVSATSGYLRIAVTFGSLPVTNQSVSVAIANKENGLFDNVTKAQALAGDINYRCYYIRNTHATDTATDVVMWIAQDAVGVDDMAIGSDPAGVGDGVTTGVATTIGSETSAPGGVTFTAPTSEGAGISLGTFLAGQGRAVWVRRNVPVGSTTATADDTSKFRFRFLT